MKTMIRSVCVAAAALALSGCGVPKEQYQQLQDKFTANEQQLAQARQDVTSLQNTLAQKETELTHANEQMQAWQLVLRRSAQEIEKLKSGKSAGGEKPKGVKTTPKTTSKTTKTKGKTGSHSVKKPASETTPASQL